MGDIFRDERGRFSTSTVATAIMVVTHLFRSEHRLPLHERLGSRPLYEAEA